MATRGFLCAGLAMTLFLPALAHADEGAAASKGSQAGSVVAPTRTLDQQVADLKAQLAQLTDELRSLRQQLKKPASHQSGEKRDTRIISLHNAEAANLLKIIRPMFPADGDEQVVLTADERTNSLVVQAGAEQFQAVIALVDQLDEDGPATTRGKAEVRVFALKHVQAEALAAAIRPVVSQRGDDAVQLSVDSRTNSLLVKARAPQLQIIEALFNQLDKAEGAR